MRKKTDNADDLNLDVNMVLVIPLIREVFKGVNLHFTAGWELSGHGKRSLHHSGNAVDIRTKTLADKGVGIISFLMAHHLQEAIDKKFGSGNYLVLYNDAGPDKPHLHVQFNAGGRWSAPGDYPTPSKKQA